VAVVVLAVDGLLGQSVDEPLVVPHVAVAAVVGAGVAIVVGAGLGRLLADDLRRSSRFLHHVGLDDARDGRRRLLHDLLTRHRTQVYGIKVCEWGLKVESKS
jgi:hypothetical protein